MNEFMRIFMYRNIDRTNEFIIILKHTLLLIGNI